MMPSSFRSRVSPAKRSGSLGTSCSSATTECVTSAFSVYVAAADCGALRPTDPPVMNRNPVFVATRSGFTIVSQCLHTVRLTSAGVRQVCEVRSTMYVVKPSPFTVLTISYL